jgi:diguanylate cyclase (GGDEF)-like protein/PAS domain S-box-containing protein
MQKKNDDPIMKAITAKSTSLNRVLTSRLILLVSLVSIIAAMSNYIYLTNDAKAKLQLQLLEYSNHLSDSLKTPLWNMDDELIISISEAFVSNSAISYLTIVDEDNNSLFKYGKLGGDDVSRSLSIQHNGHLIGSVEIGLSPQSHEAHNQQLLLINITVTLLIVALLIFAIRWLLSSRLSQPIDLLSASVRNVVDGKYPNVSTEGNYTEFQPIIEDFNLMSATIAAREFSLRSSEQRLNSILDNVDAHIYLKDTEGRYIFANKLCLDLWQTSIENVIGRKDEDFFDAKMVPTIRANDQKVLVDGELVRAEETGIVSKTGKEATYWAVKIPLRDVDNHIYALCGISVDITERKHAEDALRIAATAFESQEGIFVTDAHHVILRVNQAFTRITGYSEDEAIGKTPKLLSSDRHSKDFYVKMWESINKYGSWQGEIWNRRKGGEIYPQSLSIAVVKSNAGVLTNYVATLTDITQIKTAAEEVNSLAFFDTLTKLPNRRLLIDRLGKMLATFPRSGQIGAVLFLDLDHFKDLNDSLGHDIGDQLLQQVGQRLVDSVREGDTVARLGGDEFVVLLESLSTDTLEAASQTEVIGNKILYALNQPYTLGLHIYRSSSSIGATLLNDRDTSIEALLRKADIAMYEAKSSGRNTLRFFDPKMQEAIVRRHELIADLQEAISQQQFRLYYQIQVNQDGHPLGAEALIRWQHPQRGMISPFNFISLAEETGLILPIGQWVLETVCAQLKAWEQNPLMQNLTISINVSAKQFQQKDFVAQVQSSVMRHAIDPTQLNLELTESMLLDDISGMIAKMNVLREIGIRFELDDFGTGYSCLQYLKQLPLNKLKIDQSFVRDIVIDNSDRALVHTIISMASNLELEVIAEGVETTEQRQLLLDSGCNYFQGYLFGKPIPVDEFEALLRKS